ncbi:zinc ribbon domain-containing protein [Candidatus Villigracilis saccharophilus]|uniref:zinc ribbon domain-containing protein n=1 Tax=Candidatus Villigracilis saccharophilus TaxID=3140684 RepID=UPI003136F252|nr:zinc ribbon domain-containing protein [Anaerolineales bacterium]
MYSWDDDTSGWSGSAKYQYSPAAAPARIASAERAKAAGPRTYQGKSGPNEKIIDPKKIVSTESTNPLIVAIDVTGSMSSWPAEIFDRLPLLFNTLAQYRPDTEICFAAIGDAGVDRWPLQVTSFASGYDLEQLLGALYGEGGGGDAPESYGLFAHWVNTHVQTPNAQEAPFLIVFGDINMHAKIPAAQVKHYLGEEEGGGIKDWLTGGIDSIDEWQKVTQKWNTWFLRRPGGKKGDKIDAQWSKAIGAQKIFHIEDEQRAVDYAMGLVARSWGYFGDFQENMRARQDSAKVEQVSKPIEMICPRCGAPIPVRADGMFKCGFCGTTLKL